MNFPDFYSKLFKNLYNCNFRLNLLKKNDATLRYPCISSFSIGDHKNLRVPISSESVYFYYFAPPYWIRFFKLLSYEL